MRVLLVLSFIIAFNSNIYSQDSLVAPYLRFPGFPPVKLLKTDSSGFFTKADLPGKRKVMLVLFSPDCDHCQQEAEALSGNLDKFKNVYIVMATTAPLFQIKAFADRYKLSNKANIQLGRDSYSFLPSFYNINSTPFHAFYNKKKELISVKEGSLPIDKIVAELGK